MAERTLARYRARPEGETLAVEDTPEVDPELQAKTTYVWRVLATGLVASIVLQRFIIPVGENGVSMTLVVAFAVMVLLRVRGGLRYDLFRMGLFLLGTAGCVAASYLSTISSGGVFSLSSLLLLLVLYVPWMFCVHRDYTHLYERFARLFVRLMVVVSLLGVGEILAQLSGLWQYKDYLGTWFPANLLAQTYNTNATIAYDSPIYRAQAFVLLEPSFLSQFAALGVIVAVLFRRPSWQIFVMILGLAASVSGTGILLLVAGLILVLVRRPDVVRPSQVIVGLIGLGIVLASPAGTLLLDRRDEATTQGSSGYMRFVQPYIEVGNGLAEDPIRYVIGAGPGTSERLLESDRGGRAGDAVVYSIVPKLVFEYGLFAGLLFVGFLLVALFRYPPVRVLSGTVFVMLFFLSGSLLQAQTIVIGWMLTSLWARASRTRG